MDDNRWSIWVDVEGFAAIYQKDEGRAMRGLGDLMEVLYRVGSSIFSQTPDRLFVHHFGDGFVVVSDFAEDAPDRPIALAIAMTRHLLLRGMIVKCAISSG